MNSILKNMAVSSPYSLPEPDEYRSLIMAKIAMMREKLRMENLPDKILWSEPFFSEDGKTVSFRTEFRNDEPGAVSFRFDEMARPLMISGKGVEEMRFDHPAMPAPLVAQRCKKKVRDYLRYLPVLTDGVKPLWSGAVFEEGKDGPVVRVPTFSKNGEMSLCFLFNADCDPVSIKGPIKEEINLIKGSRKELEDEQENTLSP